MAEEKKKTQTKKTPAKNTKKTVSTAKKVKQKAEEQNQFQIPVRLTTSVICLALFIVFLVMFLSPEGALILALKNFILGLVGKVAFYVAIPGLLYLFIIQAFSGKKPIMMSSI